MSPPEPPEKHSDADQQWLDRLSGRLAAATDPEALREADALRSAILHEQAREVQAAAAKAPELQKSEDDAGAQRLLFALRREGLLSHTETASTHIQPKRKPWMVPSALAASVLVGFLALQALQFGQVAVQYDEPPTMRGEIQSIVIRDKAPKEKAEALAAQLKAAGLSARLYQTGNKFYVDTDLIAEKLDAAAPTLLALGLKDQTGQARIEITKP